MANIVKLLFAILRIYLSVGVYYFFDSVEFFLFNHCCERSFHRLTNL